MPVTTAAAWKQAAHKTKMQHAEQLELPSGAVILACRPGIETWLIRGRIPEALSGVVLALSGSDEQRRPITPEDAAELGRFNRDVIIATVIEPRVVDGTAGDGEISFAEIPDEDADFILAWARRAPEAASLESFRERPGLSAAGAGSTDVRPAAEPDAANPGPGAGA